MLPGVRYQFSYDLVDPIGRQEWSDVLFSVKFKYVISKKIKIKYIER